jgi:isoprenylcysteine carboxyl methyltransferase (ICMT) family protein YpbQ
MVHCAWITAVVFTLANAPVLWRRVRCENRALALAVAGGGR